MILKAWDKKRNQEIPPRDFALTGDGRLLIRWDKHIPPYDTGWAESDEIKAEDVEVTVDEVP